MAHETSTQNRPVGGAAIEKLWALMCQIKATETFSALSEGDLGEIEGISCADMMAQMKIVLHDAFEQIQGYKGFEINQYGEGLKEEVLLKAVNINIDSHFNPFQA
ncbi:hypothetical protein HYFRA_00012531 [Hymenoscyphus fraxineus]|uniref:Uncharacterized protein n=1 Tax=Hymenoscyphus fraxineus TaxID=746836 RepID=A0A9N9PKF5_9HELO|nr:hypothetical protein HYFRA_00012531 [Hymenoscyphus fraxineus]